MKKLLEKFITEIKAEIDKHDEIYETTTNKRKFANSVNEIRKLKTLKQILLSLHYLI